MPRKVRREPKPRIHRDHISALSALADPFNTSVPVLHPDPGTHADDLIIPFTVSHNVTITTTANGKQVLVFRPTWGVNDHGFPTITTSTYPLTYGLDSGNNVALSESHFKYIRPVSAGIQFIPTAPSTQAATVIDIFQVDSYRVDDTLTFGSDQTGQAQTTTSNNSFVMLNQSGEGIDEWVIANNTWATIGVLHDDVIDPFKMIVMEFTGPGSVDVGVVKLVTKCEGVYDVSLPGRHAAISGLFHRNNANNTLVTRALQNVRQMEQVIRHPRKHEQTVQGHVVKELENVARSALITGASYLARGATDYITGGNDYAGAIAGGATSLLLNDTIPDVD